jgi:hypothetical protein
VLEQFFADHSLPDYDEGGGEILRAVLNPAGEVFEVEPVAALDFFRVQLKRSLEFAAVDPDEFLAGFGAGIELEEFFGKAGEGDAEFFFSFTESAVVIGFADVEVSGSRRIPCAGKAVFAQGTFLEEDLASLVEDEDVDGAVLQAAAVDFGARRGSDDFVLFVYDVEDFFGHGFLLGSLIRSRVMSSLRRLLYFICGAIW